MTRKDLEKALNRSSETILRIADQYRESNPEWFAEYKAKHNKVTEHFSPQLVEIIKGTIGDIQEAPEGWMANGTLAKTLDCSEKTIAVFVSQYEESHSEWFRVYKGRGHVVTRHYAPELVALIKKEFVDRRAPEGWMNTYSLANALDVSSQTILKIANQYQEINPEWFVAYVDRGGKHREHYAPALVEVIKAKVSEYAEAPEGWMYNNALAKQLMVGERTILKTAEPYRESHLEWFRKYKTKRGLVTEHYAPALVEIIKATVSEYAEAPEGWITNGALSDVLKCNEKTILKIADRYKEDHPEWFLKYKGKSGFAADHFSPQLVEKIKEELARRQEAPEGWMTNKGLARALRVSDATTSSVAEKYREDHPEWFVEYKLRGKGKGTGMVTEHLHPDLVAKIREEILSRK
jgi:uncharacterized protein (DUF924 family)